MARKKVIGSPEPVAGKKRKKTSRRKATSKTAAEICRADDPPDESAIRPGAPGQSAIKTPPGIICPRCGCRDLRAPDGRPWEIVKTEVKYGFIRRRRVCRYCGRIVYTRERREDKE